jgi:hypothetical protein
MSQMLEVRPGTRGTHPNTRYRELLCDEVPPFPTGRIAIEFGGPESTKQRAPGPLMHPM